MVKSYLAKPKEVKREYLLVDATDQVLGRLAVKVAKILMGKHRPTWTPGVDTGDFVVVINAAKLRFTGKKMMQKTYQRYSGYPGGLHERTLEEVLKREPTRVFLEAVKGMVPRGPLGKVMMRKLKIYAGSEHRHQAQQLKKLELN